MVARQPQAWETGRGLVFGEGNMITADVGGSQVRSLLEPPGNGGPTVLRLLLGAQLRRAA